MKLISTPLVYGQHAQESLLHDRAITILLRDENHVNHSFSLTAHEALSLANDLHAKLAENEHAMKTRTKCS